MFPKDENSNPNPKFRDNPDSFNPFGNPQMMKKNESMPKFGEKINPFEQSKP